MRAIGTSHRRPAFSLIELLVVVSIVALLMALLLPALGRAREASRRAVCLGQLRSFGQGLAMYVGQHNGYLPGPNTSGGHIPQGAPVSVIGDRNIDPTYNMDWISPTMGDMLNLPNDRNERIQAIFNDELRCPSNDVEYDFLFNGSDVPVSGLNYASYSSPLGFHATENSSPTDFDTSVNNNVPRAPDNYSFRIDEVGPPSNKVWALEGVRYVRADGQVSYNDFVWQDEGGNFMTHSPAYGNLRAPGSPHQTTGGIRPTEASLQYAYRHDSGMNMIFFDGHGERVNNEDSRDTALYFPTGSQVMLITDAVDTRYSPGDILP